MSCSHTNNNTDCALCATPKKFNLKAPIWQGDIYRLKLRFKANDEPISLEGKTVVFTIKENIETPDDEAVVHKVRAIPDPDAAAADGYHMIVLQPSETALLPLQTFVYQIQLITPAGVDDPEDIVQTYLWGKVSVKNS